MYELRFDPLLKDKKSLPLSYYGTTVPLFLLYVFILFPCWLLFLLPLTILYQSASYILKLCMTKLLIIKKYNNNTVLKEDIIYSDNSDVCKDKTVRIYDIIVFGATGFTGKMACNYIAKNYNSKIKWAISGRSRSALEALKREINTICSSSQDNVDIIIADATNLDSLNSMTKLTKVVITTAGPFDKYGSMLVQSCVLQGTDYCDITGESDWVRKMIDLYDDAAKNTGARIVNFCGHDCVPWDLLTLECVKLLNKKGEVLTIIKFYDEINSSPSGGTLATVFHSLNNRTHYKSMLGYDPILKTRNGSKSDMKLIAKNTSYLTYDRIIQKFVGPFIMAMVMANCVKRSNALNNYSPKIIYKESAVYPSFMAGFISMLNLIIFGQGPSEIEMDAGFLKITGLGIGSNGTKVRSMLYFPTDPGYRDTARMLVEAGLVLALESDQLKLKGGGIFTPASCQGEFLMQRLLKTGTILHTEYL